MAADEEGTMSPEEKVEKWVNEIWPNKPFGAHAGVTVPKEAIADLLAERDKWKSEYENLCKFANDLEEQRDAYLGVIKFTLAEFDSGLGPTYEWFDRMRAALSRFEKKDSK